MTRNIYLNRVGCWVFLFFVFLTANSSSLINVAYLIDVKGAIGPATQDFIHRSFEKAQKAKANLIVIQLDTPGGLDKSMREIIRDIISSPIPVITYVSPGGARAASAGTYILYASHIAAMAPGTNLGAATPVSIGGDFGKNNNDKEKKEVSNGSVMSHKITSDANAYIRSLAQLRGRNVEWAQKAVLEGASLSAEEAQKQKVIDLVARNLSDLLQQMNGRTFIINGKSYSIENKNWIIKKVVPDWRTRFLEVITEPNVAYILLLIGVYGLFFEFVNPGFVLPGVAGVICLLIALYAFQLLPVNYVGFALLVTGIVFMILEAFVTSFGALGIGGIIAFIVGSIMLFDEGGAAFAIALPLIIAVSIVTAGFFLLVVNLALRSRFRPVVSGKEELVGSEGVVLIGDQGLKRIRVRGELWQVRSDSPLTQGQKVKVIGVNGLVLIVKPM